MRDVGNSGLNGDLALRDAIEGGWVARPRMVAPREHSRRRVGNSYPQSVSLLIVRTSSTRNIR